MPDTLKQLYSGTINVTGLTGNQTATLFTNNATTRVVIKDVDVTNTFPIQPNLTVGGTGVAAIVGSLTGSEIVDVSQAVGISFPTALSYSQLNLQYLTSNAGNTSRTISTAYRINSIQVSSTSATADNAANRSNSMHGYYYVAADNDVFFHQHNGTTAYILSKRAGGPTGTGSNIVNSQYPIAFDGRFYYYLTSTTNLRRFDPETETTTDTTIVAIADAFSGARMIHSNGYLFYIYADGAPPYIIKISNGFWSYQTGWSGIYTGNNRSMPGFFIDPVTLVVTSIYVDGSSQTIRARTNSAASSFASSSQTDSAAPTYVTKSQTTWSPQTNVTTPMVAMTGPNTGLMHFGNSETYLFDCTTAAAAGWTNSGPLTTTVDPNFIFSATFPTPTVNTTNFPTSLALRVTGVEITP